ncbi:MAG: YbaN family protein [Pseudomonadota bacterium]
MSQEAGGDRQIDRTPRRVIWLAIGGGALGLGAIGIVLPLLPTTPFVLVAAFAFGKSSPRLAIWLETSRAFGPIIADWRRHGAIAPRFKVLAVAMMGGVLALSIIAALSVWVLIVQAVCMTGAAAFILSRPNGPA